MPLRSRETLNPENSRKYNRTVRIIGRERSIEYGRKCNNAYGHMHNRLGSLPRHLCSFSIGKVKFNLEDRLPGWPCQKISAAAVFTTTLTMPPSPTEKTQESRAVKPYASEPGPKGRNSQSRPATSAQPLKKSKPPLTISDWLYHPHATQTDVVSYFKRRPEGALLFNQGSLSRNLRKRNQREAGVEANPAALSSVVTRPDVDQDKEDNDNDGELINLAELMEVARKLENEAPTVGGSGFEVSKLCRRFRLELKRVMNLKAQQTTLDESS